MLQGKNKRKMFNKALCLSFALLICINTFAAVVSDNDGSAFITKAEFEALKQNFADQVNNYNYSIDNKIDGAIASYLAGLKTSTRTIIKTGINIQGNENTMEFFGKSKILDNSNNEVYSYANVFCCIASGYSSNDWWWMDMQHALALKATWSDGNEENAVFERDGNYIKQIYNNIKVLINNSASGYGASTTLFHYGGLWSKLKLIITEPSEDDLKGNHSPTVWPYDREIEGIGFENYGSHRASERSWPNHSHDIGFRAESGDSCVYWSNPTDAKSIVNCADAAYSCTWLPESKSAVYCHWPWGINNTMRVKQIIRDSTGTITEKSHYRFVDDQTFTNTVVVNSRTGSAFNLNRGDDICTQWPLTIEDTKGYVAYLNTNLENIGDYYYQELKNVENVDEKLGHGFYLCSNENHEGYVELTLQSDTDNTKIFFSKNEFSSTISTDDYLECEIYNQATKTWETTKSPTLTSKDTQYKIRVNFDASAKKIYIAVAGSGDDINNFDIKLTQMGDAILNII